VTVPAGTFMAIKVSSVDTITPSTAAPSTSVFTSWWVKGIGMVKTLAYWQMAPAQQTVAVLTSYSPR
jgi:hypothetical protein